MAYLFLSYAEDDNDSAFAMRDVLRKEGFFVWMNENTDELSHRWYWSRIQRNIQNAGAFVILVSEAAKESAVVKRELDYAEKIKKPIIPILLEGEGWSRLGMEAAKLGLGLHLDISDEMVQQIKNHFPTNPDRATPPQIQPFRLPKLEQKNLFLGISLIAIFLVALLRFSPLLQNLGIVSPQRPHLTNERLEAFFAELRQTQVALTSAPTSTATSASPEVIAARETHAAAVQLTAAAGNGSLPCWGNVQTGFRRNNLVKIYTVPSLDSAWISSSTSLDIDRVLLTEWVVNDDGAWYRAGSQRNMNIGYMLAEDLELAVTCPR